MLTKFPFTHVYEVDQPVHPYVHTTSILVRPSSRTCAFLLWFACRVDHFPIHSLQLVQAAAGFHFSGSSILLWPQQLLHFLATADSTHLGLLPLGNPVSDLSWSQHIPLPSSFACVISNVRSAAGFTSLAGAHGAGSSVTTVYRSIRVGGLRPQFSLQVMFLYWWPARVHPHPLSSPLVPIFTYTILYWLPSDSSENYFTQNLKSKLTWKFFLDNRQRLTFCVHINIFLSRAEPNLLSWNAFKFCQLSNGMLLLATAYHNRAL